MTVNEKDELKLTKDGELNSEAVELLFNERFECLLKGIFAVSTN